MKINTRLVVILSLFIGIVGVLSAMALGFWDGEESEKTPAKFEALTGFEGQYMAEGIRGSFTLGEINELYNVPLSHLAKTFHVEESQAASFKLKDLSTIFPEEEGEIGTGSVKLFVAFYLGQPYDLGDSTTLITAEGAEILRADGKATPEQLAYLDTHILGMATPKEAPVASEAATPNTDPSQSVTISVSGSAYFKDLASTYDIPLDDLAKAFDVTGIEAPFYQVKDLKTDYNAETSKINNNSVKMFISFYKGVKFDLSNAESQIPAAGVEILLQKGAMLPEQAEYLKDHTYK